MVVIYTPTKLRFHPEQIIWENGWTTQVMLCLRGNVNGWEDLPFPRVVLQWNHVKLRNQTKIDKATSLGSLNDY